PGVARGEARDLRALAVDGAVRPAHGDAVGAGGAHHHSLDEGLAADQELGLWVRGHDWVDQNAIGMGCRPAPRARGRAAAGAPGGVAAVWRGAEWRERGGTPSTRPAASSSFCLPVKNGWQALQTSRRISFFVEWVSN